MKAMIAVTCLALASCAAASGWAGAPANIALSQDGRNILDTPEVAQAKAAHLQALAQAQSRQGYENSNDDGSYDPRWENEENWQQQNHQAAPSWNSAPAPAWNAAPAHAPAPAWNAAPAPAAWNNNPLWNAQPEHQAAWNAPQPQAHAAWNAPQPQHQPQWNAPQPQWNGAPSWQAAPHNAQIRLSNDGQHVLDTPEVAAARAAHLQAYAQAASAAGPAHH